jgi:hypothetical protein
MNNAKLEPDPKALGTYRLAIALAMSIAEQYDLRRLLSVSPEEQDLLLHMRANRVDPRILKACLEREAV